MRRAASYGTSRENVHSHRRAPAGSAKQVSSYPLSAARRPISSSETGPKRARSADWAIPGRPGLSRTCSTSSPEPAARARPSGSPNAWLMLSSRSTRGTPSQGGPATSRPSSPRTCSTSALPPSSREITRHPPERRRCAARSAGLRGTITRKPTPWTAVESAAMRAGTGAGADFAGTAGRGGGAACACCFGAGKGGGAACACSCAGAGFAAGGGLGSGTTRKRCSALTGLGAGTGSCAILSRAQGRPAISAALASASVCRQTDRRRRGGSLIRRLSIHAHPHDQLGRARTGYLRKTDFLLGREVHHHHLAPGQLAVERLAAEGARLSTGAAHVEALLARRGGAGLRGGRPQPQEEKLGREQLRHHHQREKRERELLLGEEAVDEPLQLVEPAVLGPRGHRFSPSPAKDGIPPAATADGSAIFSSAQAGSIRDVGRRSRRTSSRRYASSPRSSTEPC